MSAKKKQTQQQLPLTPEQQGQYLLELRGKLDEIINYITGKGVTIEMASIITGYSVSTIYKMVSLGQIPYKKERGGALRFDPHKLNEWKLTKTSA